MYILQSTAFDISAFFLTDISTSVKVISFQYFSPYNKIYTQWFFNFYWHFIFCDIFLTFIKGIQLIFYSNIVDFVPFNIKFIWNPYINFWHFYECLKCFSKLCFKRVLIPLPCFFYAIFIIFCILRLLFHFFSEMRSLPVNFIAAMIKYSKLEECQIDSKYQNEWRYWKYKFNLNQKK